MKIVFIGQKGIPNVLGGVERHVEELAVRLVKNGQEVIVYTRPKYVSKKLKEHKGVRLISLPAIPTKHLDTITHTFLACLDVVFFRDVDLIHFHSIGPCSLIWLIRILKPKAKVIATFHTQCYLYKKWGFLARQYLKFGEYVCLKMSDSVITVSRILKDYAQNKYKREIVYIPNSVDLPEILPPKTITQWGLKKKNYILTVVRLVPTKGIHYLINAYNNLRTDKKLVIVGEGVYTDKYVRGIKKLASKNPNIIFIGKQIGKMLAELYSNAYVFVLPSENEGLSISLLEAMSFGRSVLTSDIPENKQVIRDAGFTFRNKDEKDLKDKLDNILVNPVLVREKGKLCKARVKKEYLWDNVVIKVIKLYKETMYKEQLLTKLIKSC